MEFVRITSIHDPLFGAMHGLMQRVYPAEEVLVAEAWAGPLQDENLRVCVAVHEGQVVGATEYRYMPDVGVAMSDFTIVAATGLGVGRFIWERREADLKALAKKHGQTSLGMFAEIYDPGRVTHLQFGDMPAMHPVVRREVLSHMGYRRLDFAYVHPSWQQNGEAVHNLDLCFLPAEPGRESVPADLVVRFLTSYYAILPNKPAAWHAMIDGLKARDEVALRPL